MGLSADYVERETRPGPSRRSAGRPGSIPGIDVDVPHPTMSVSARRRSVRAGVAAALDGGADGFVLSRKYSEMTLDNLAAVGDELTHRNLR